MDDYELVDTDDLDSCSESSTSDLADRTINDDLDSDESCAEDSPMYAHLDRTILHKVLDDHQSTNDDHIDYTDDALLVTICVIYVILSVSYFCA